MSVWLWVGFVAFVLFLLVMDLGVFNRRTRVVSTRRALGMTAGFISLALAFNVAVYFIYERHWFGMGLNTAERLDGWNAALRFFTGWVIEYSLSLDNIFVIAVIFSYFGVPRMYQHRVLFWGIVGALVMRGVMIALGAALIHRFHWIIYVFGALLVLTAIKMLRSSDAPVQPDRNPLVRLARRLYPVTSDFREERFFARIDGVSAITPLFLVLLVVESTDVLFAIDSIPAIFAITHDPFIVFTSNVFAILGLRSLFFALAGMLDMFRYLKYSLVFILAFVGVKMLLTEIYPIHIEVSLPIIAAALLAGVVASLAARRNSTAQGTQQQHGLKPASGPEGE